MFNLFSATSKLENRPPITKSTKKRFGIIPSEPCRASSMQNVWQPAYNDQLEKLAE